MAGSALNTFYEFGQLTGPTIMSSAKAVVNDAQLRNMQTLGYVLRGKRMNEVLKGGSQLRDYIYLQANRIARSYLPGQAQNYQIRGSGTTWTVDWRFFLTDMVWEDHEIELNAGGDLSREAMFHMYKDLWFRKQQDLWTDQMEYIEKVFWAVPDKTKMEAAGGQEWYSIPCGINEYANSLPASSDQPGGAWTTHQQIDPLGFTNGLSNANWKCSRETYGSAAAAGNGWLPLDSLNILGAFDRGMMAIGITPPPMKAEYFEAPTVTASKVCFASLKGKARLMDFFRRSQNVWVDKFDPFNNPTYNGMPIVYVAALDDARIYPTNAAGALGVESDTANSVAGPRFTVVCPEYLTVGFHKNRYFKDLGLRESQEQPTRHVVPYDTYGNVMFRSKRRHLQISPVGNQN